MIPEWIHSVFSNMFPTELELSSMIILLASPELEGWRDSLWVSSFFHWSCTHATLISTMSNLALSLFWNIDKHLYS